ncbi:MAG: SDR family oxidoreductase [Anaerolineae bacterium]|jgi:NAD(P)-dependent dehydrogenase (short-subunit alcohol dehydrogenase family)
MLIEKMDLSRDALAGKVALITGAGQGIGKELARNLAWLGAKVIIAEIAETGADVEALIRSAGGTALFVQTDVGDEESVQALADRAFETFGRVDILVNNAIVYQTGSLLEVPVEAWDRAYAVNLRGAVMAIRTFLPGMLDRQDGVIVTITSQEGMPYAAPYFASKAALRSLGLSLAAELDEEAGVSAFVFAPGMVDTPGGNAAFRAMAPRFGLSYQEFTEMGTNPGYAGLMPAEDCATGLAYTIVHARDYHGQIADPFRPLAQAGLLPGEVAAKPPNEHRPMPPGQVEGPATATRDPAEGPSPSSIRQCVDELRTVLEEVCREFNELDIFRKMYARRDFQHKAGMSIDDWLEVVADLAPELEILEQRTEASETEDTHQMRGKLAWLTDNLAKLADYFEKTRQDARSFIRDPKALEAALEALNHRERVVRALISVLEHSPVR